MIEIASLVYAERDRQESLALSGKFDRTCADPDMPFEERLAVLTEEIGEVASAYQAYLAGRPDNLADELVQVAAVCVAWLESLGWNKGDVVTRVVELASPDGGSLSVMIGYLGYIVTAPTPEHVVALENLAAEAVSWAGRLSRSLLDG